MKNFKISTISTKKTEIFKQIIEKINPEPSDKDGGLVVKKLIDKKGGVVNTRDIPLNFMLACADQVAKMVFHSNDGITFHDNAIAYSKKYPNEKIVCEYYNDNSAKSIVEYQGGNIKRERFDFAPPQVNSRELTDFMDKNGLIAAEKINAFVKGIYANKLINPGDLIKQEFIMDNWKIVARISFDDGVDYDIYEQKKEWSEVDILPF